MIQLYQISTPLKVLSHFYKNPHEGFYLRELSRILEMDKMTVKRALKVLTEDGLIKKYTEKNLILYKGNSEDPRFTFGKVSFNLSLIKETGMVEHIVKSVRGLRCIVLYGSFAKGENAPGSDIDLLIISSTEVKPFSMVETPWEINPTFMSLDDWVQSSKYNKPFYIDILRQSIVLHGTLPVIE